ncbi:phosphotransferase family protein [Streptomyces sp. NBC_01408]|uniref:phosphotransferase family protein n=1 Tax=Streptomyces sp. NBC_01408 TaxID=2903855 RepID=UPI0022512B6C|nr:phosphotransferase [Streptomyces sp. NBC_01408]MCX4692894.1 phosphotransferase [Streptomyces sp. NBC_01408]
MHILLIDSERLPGPAAPGGPGAQRAAASLTGAGHTVAVTGPGEAGPPVERPGLVFLVLGGAGAGPLAAAGTAIRTRHPGVPVVAAGLAASLDPQTTMRILGADGSLPGDPGASVPWLVEEYLADPSVLKADSRGRIRPAFGQPGPAASGGEDPLPVEEIAARAARQLGLGTPVPAGTGFEFAVFRGSSRELGDVALRVPRQEVIRYGGRDPYYTRDALEQERVIAAHLHARGLPVPEPIALVNTPLAPVLASRFLPGAGVAAGPEQIGELMARLHLQPPPPGLRPLDHDGWPIDVGVARRVSTRWAWLAGLVPDLPELPGLDRLVPLLAPLAGVRRLLHLDMRAPNMAGSDGEVAGLFDWGCAMIGHPALELARVRENDTLPENDLDIEALLAGYRRHAPEPVLPPAVDALLRLDGVTMLCVVFGGGEEPDRERLALLVERAKALAEEVK